MTHRSFHAPGRVNLIGEHTDYSGGLVLPAAISRGVTMDVELGGDRIVLRSELDGATIDLPADGSDMPPSGWGRYVAAVAAELADLGRAPIGMRGRLTSDLPTGSGLSSSAALEVAVGTGLCAAAGFELGALELAAALQRAEFRGVGVPCGIMDQAASLLGRVDHAVLLDCGSLEHRAVPLPGGVRLAIIDTGVRRELGTSGYATRRVELEAAMAALGGVDPKDVDPEEVAAMAERAGLDDLHLRRLRHVVTENERVRQVEQSLIATDGPDRSALGRLFAAGHASLRDDFEVSVPELDALVDAAVGAGAIAARMTGGGFGGAILALVDAGTAADVVEATLLDYRRRFPSRQPTAIVTRATDGARELDT